MLNSRKPALEKGRGSFVVPIAVIIYITTYSCLPLTYSAVLHPNRWAARSDPNISALCGTDEMELKGAAGLKIPVATSLRASFEPGG